MEIVRDRRKRGATHGGAERSTAVDVTPSMASSLLRLQSTAGNAATLALLGQDGPSTPPPDVTIRRDVDLDEDQQAQYADMGAMSEWTKRAAKVTSVAEGGVNEAIAVFPRKADGSLTDEAIAAIEQFEKGVWDETYAVWMNQTTTLPPKIKTGLLKRLESDSAHRKRIAKLAKAQMKANTNPVTALTSYPELRNLTESNGEVDAPISEQHTLAGTTVTVDYNKSDVNADLRLTMIRDAMQLIATAGGHFGGGLVFNLPKYGRAVSVRADGNGLTESDSGTRACFVAPSYVHLSSEIPGNPYAADETLTGTPRLQFLSAQLDPLGVASVVHELGHYSHYLHSPSQYHLLSGAAWKGDAGRLAAMVSMYAYSNPREFVAEVFLALVYGRSFDPETLAMYLGLGGMPVGAARSVKPKPVAEILD